MEPFVGQLMLASFNYAPKNWVQCNGQLMAINTNQALFSLLGTYYGGNGIQNFALPNLQGRTPIGFSSGFPIGQLGGEEAHTLTAQEVPLHAHQLYAASGGGNSDAPAGAMPAGGGANVFAAPSSQVNMNAGTLPPFGGSQPHENRQPYLVMNWCIALFGIFPSRN